jgi:hypothetical protein
MASATADGVTLFANSDRPLECQRVVCHCRRPAAEATLRCQYLEIAEDGETATIRTQPHWLWGLEHGVNEHRSHRQPDRVRREPGLPAPRHGLVRLASARRNARQALATITSTREARPGGSVSPRRMALPQRLPDRRSARRGSSRLPTVTGGAARRRGRQRHERRRHRGGLTDGRVTRRPMPSSRAGGPRARAGHFAAAYGDSTGVPEPLRRTPRRQPRPLAEMRGRLTLAAPRAVLRDHHGRQAFRAAESTIRTLPLSCTPIRSTTRPPAWCLLSSNPPPRPGHGCPPGAVRRRFVPLYPRGRYRRS